MSNDFEIPCVLKISYHQMAFHESTRHVSFYYLVLYWGQCKIMHHYC